jgi:diacylglycerol kinase (ATP)
MRAAAILGIGCSTKDLRPFQDQEGIEWRLGMPAVSDVDAVLIFGGDGTIHRHLGHLVKLGLPALVVPAGSGNDFARSLRLKRISDSLAAWKRFCTSQDNVREVDLGLVIPLESSGQAQPGFRYFCCVAGVGLDTEVARRANGLPRWIRAHGGYPLSLAPAIFQFAPFPIKLLTGEGTSSTETWTTRSDRPTTLAAIANTSTFGGGMRIAPGAKLDDGLLDVCLVGGLNPFKLACMFPTIYFGRHLSIKEVEYFQAVQVRIETEHPVDVYADGEYVCRTPVEVTVQRRALRVIVPAE